MTSIHVSYSMLLPKLVYPFPHAKIKGFAFLPTLLCIFSLTCLEELALPRTLLCELSNFTVIASCFLICKQDLLFLLSWLCAFRWGLRGQQLEIRLPHFTVFRHIHQFVWVKFQAIPSKILDVIGVSSSKLSNWSSPHLLWQVKCVWVAFREAFYCHGQTI